MVPLFVEFISLVCGSWLRLVILTFALRFASCRDGKKPCNRCNRWLLFLFVAECYYRVYVCGSYCGVEAEDDADCDADSDGEDDAFEGNNREHAGEICDHPRNEHAQSYTHQAANG